MRVLLIAASVAAALAMPVASSAQSIGLGYETDVSSVTGSAVNQGTGIVVPLPCPPTGECVNPWADQKPTVIEGFSDQFNDLYNQNLVLGDSHQGLLGEYGTFDLQGMTSGY